MGQVSVTGNQLSALNSASPLQAALAYAELGLPVFPVAPVDRATGVCRCREGAACEVVGKHPLVAWADRATTDSAQIERWWRSWKPDANIGMPTGARSGLIAVDIDRQHDGLATRQALANAGYRFPPTLAQRTRSGGWHFLYRAPDARVANTTAALAGVGETPGIDVRGDGGYIIVAPSIRPLEADPTTGELHLGRYAWAAEDLQPAQAPAWVTTPPPRPTPPGETSQRQAEVGRAGRDPHKRAAAALAAEVALVAGAGAATRNTRLFQAAANLFEIVNTGYLDESQVREALTAAALQVGLPESEVRATLDAQWRRKQGVRRSGWETNSPGQNKGSFERARAKLLLDASARARGCASGFGR